MALDPAEKQSRYRANERLRLAKLVENLARAEARIADLEAKLRAASNVTPPPPPPIEPPPAGNVTALLLAAAEYLIAHPALFATFFRYVNGKDGWDAVVAAIEAEHDT